RPNTSCAADARRIRSTWPERVALLGLLELQHEDVDRNLRIEDREIVRIVGIAQEVPLIHALEAGGLNLALERALLDAVIGLADRRARAGRGGVIGDHEIAA